MSDDGQGQQSDSSGSSQTPPQGQSVDPATAATPQTVDRSGQISVQESAMPQRVQMGRERSSGIDVLKGILKGGQNSTD